MKHLITAAALLLSLVPAAAATIDFDKKVVQIDGSAFTDGKPEDATFRKLVVNVLLAQYQDEPQLAGDVKIARFLLAQKIQTSQGPLTLSLEEAASVKALVLKALPPLFAGQIVLAIDPGALAQPKK